jgi:hypothetical protein
MKPRHLFLACSLLILSSRFASAQEKCPATKSLQDYVQCAIGVNEVAEGQEEAEKVANADGQGGSKLDLAKRFFALLDLGDFKESPDGMTFNFNPPMGLLPMQLTPRVVVHKAKLYEPLTTEIEKDGSLIPKDQQADVKDRLTKQLGDFDDTELKILFSLKHNRRTHGAAALGNGMIQELSFADYKAAANFLAERLKAWKGIDPNLDEDAPLADLPPDLQQVVKDDVAEFVARSAKALEDLHMGLKNGHYYEVGRLIANDPQASFDGSYHFRSGGAGPDEWTATAHYEYGLVSYGRYLGWARHRGGENKDTLATYLDSVKDWLVRQPRLAADLEYTRIDPFTFSAPDDHLALNLKSIRRFTGKLTYGQVMAGAQGTKFDFEARYDDFSDDKTKQDRFVSTATWTQKLTDMQAKVAGGPQLVVTLVYANKPEFRGAVDKDLGMRAGLKWSLDSPQKGASEAAN